MKVAARVLLPIVIESSLPASLLLWVTGAGMRAGATGRREGTINSNTLVEPEEGGTRKSMACGNGGGRAGGFGGTRRCMCCGAEWEAGNRTSGGRLDCLSRACAMGKLRDNRLALSDWPSDGGIALRRKQTSPTIPE